MHEITASNGHGRSYIHVLRHKNIEIEEITVSPIYDVQVQYTLGNVCRSGQTNRRVRCLANISSMFADNYMLNKSVKNI